jgi:hypothetical protein
VTSVRQHDTFARDPGGHVGELRLRRFRLGELPDGDREQVARHTAECPGCRTRLDALGDEQRAFEREIPLHRFSGGVERAARVPRATSRPRRFWLAGSLGFAAAAAGLLLVYRPAIAPERGSNNLKGGGPLASVRIAAADGSTQRSAPPGVEVHLQAGERLRLGYRAPAAGHLVALTVDEGGQVTPLYPERGPGLPVAPQGAALTYLPGSVELTGAGRERLYLFFAERPFTVDDAAAATRAAFDRSGRGDLGKMAVPALTSGSAQVFTWLFWKP